MARIIGYSRDGKGKVVGRHLKDVANTLTASGGATTAQYLLLSQPTNETLNNNNMATRYRVRKLTERECLRLQGVNEENIKKMCQCGVSRSQLMKQAGNSICVPCLTHIFRKLFIDTKPETYEQYQQLTLF